MSLKFVQNARMAPSETALEAVRRRLYEEGISAIDWARENGFDAHLVYGVLSGRSRASRGESHRIAVALGLKPQPRVTADLQPSESSSDRQGMSRDVRQRRSPS